MKKALFFAAAAVLVVGATGAGVMAHSGHSHTGYYHGPVPLPLPIIGHWPPGEGHVHSHGTEGEHSHAGSTYATHEEAHAEGASHHHGILGLHSGHTHGHLDVDHQLDYRGRITHIDAANKVVYTRNWFGLGVERSWQLNDATVIERWDGSQRWEFSNLGRGQYVHMMYDHGDARDVVKAMHVSWMAERR